MKKYIQYLALFASIVLVSSAFAVNFGMFGGASSWQGRLQKVEIVVDETICATGTETDFPILLTAATVPAGALDSDSDNQDDCADWLAFDNGTTGGKTGYEQSGTNPTDTDTARLALDIVTCTMTSGGAGATLEAWVGASVGNTTIQCDDSNDDKSIVLYYRDAQGDETQPAEDASYGSEDVYDSNYMMVLHMKGALATDIDDETSNDNDVTSGAGTLTFNQAGQIGESVDCDGTDAILTIDDSGTLTLDAVTVEMWAKAESDNQSAGVVAKYATDIEEYRFGLDTGGVTLLLFDESQGVVYIARESSDTTLNDNAFHYISANHTGGISSANIDCYVDGSITDDADFNNGVYANMDDAASDLLICRDERVDNYFDGEVDEVRISDTNRSGDWMLANYRQGSAPNTYILEQTPVSP